MPAGEAAEELCGLHGLSQHVTQPTRGDNLLDLVLSDFPDTAVTTEIHDPIGSSDHATVVETVRTCPRREAPATRHVWRFQKADCMESSTTFLPLYRLGPYHHL